jgi:hypothetical protein
MTRNDEAGPRGAAAFLSRPVIVALSVIAAIALYIFVFHDGQSPSERAPAALDERPATGGSSDLVEQPGGAAPAGEVIGGSGASDLRPNILDADEGPPPAETVEDLEVPDRINPGVVDPGPPETQPTIDQ